MKLAIVNGRGEPDHGTFPGLGILFRQLKNGANIIKDRFRDRIVLFFVYVYLYLSVFVFFFQLCFHCHCIVDPAFRHNREMDSRVPVHDTSSIIFQDPESPVYFRQTCRQFVTMIHVCMCDLVHGMRKSIEPSVRFVAVQEGLVVKYHFCAKFVHELHNQHIPVHISESVRNVKGRSAKQKSESFVRHGRRIRVWIIIRGGG